METSEINLQGGSIKNIDYSCPFLIYGSNNSIKRTCCELQPDIDYRDLENIIFSVECVSLDYNHCLFYRRMIADSDRY